ncbi:MAG: hypothetical protein ACREA9_12620 [Pyrinomonadaceae bacterium]
MKERYTRFSTKQLAAAAAVALTIVVAGPVLCQQPIPAPPADRGNGERAHQQDMSRREMQLRNLGATAAAVGTKQIQALLHKVEKDFNRIVVLHNELVRVVSGDAAPDYDFISEATGEINKRAGSLQSTLALLKPSDIDEKLKRTQFDDAHIRDALIILCRQIRSFVTNPTITTPGMIDVKESAKASADLENVIELSERIKKIAQRLK